MSDTTATLIAIAVGLLVLMLLKRQIFPQPRPSRRHGGHAGGRSKYPAWRKKKTSVLHAVHDEPEVESPTRREAVAGPRSAAEQLDKVLRSRFSAQPLLSAREAMVAKAAEQMLADLAPGWRVCPQVALGEAVRAADKRAYWTVNAKRCDMLIVDESWEPLAALEYQGAGHHQADAAARDAVKREALRRAGVVDRGGGGRPAGGSALGPHEAGAGAGAGGRGLTRPWRCAG